MIDALFPRTKQRLLGLLFGQPERSFATTELIRLARAGSGAVQRELDRLVAAGLVTATVSGTQKRLSANRASPLFEELRGIVEKTAGIADQLRSALVPLAPSLHLAVLYGSVAKDADRAASDIDVLLVTDDLTLERVFAALQPVEERVGRRVSPTLYTSEEFVRRRISRHPFLTKVLSGKHVVLLGSEDAIPAR
jgi:predicted nucleotidyltransferase